MEESLSPKKARRFDPYIFHGGTTVGLHGKDYAIIAGDTRLTNGGYSIQTRKCTKLCQLTDKCVLSSVGCQSDCIALHKIMKYHLESYKYQHGKVMTTKAIIQFLSNLLYTRRFFPYFSFCMVAGLDEFGNGISKGYDALGSIGDSGADGTGQCLIQPLLDNQIYFKNHDLVPEDIEKNGLKLEHALSVVKDAFHSASDRDIYTGDYCQIYIITQKEVRSEIVNLKND